jgi:precorrin-2 dehydrogenase/sirohydrochlorin ferrochelatase
VVIGGGGVATRKVLSLMESGAAVHVVSPALSERLTKLADAGRIGVERRPYQPGDLRGAFLAIAATDDRAVNAAVAAEARAERVLLTVCDDPDAGDITGMATLRRGALTVAVSTDGASPALARLVSEALAEFLTPEYAALLELMAAERQSARRRGPAPSADHWRAAVTPEVLTLVRAGETEAARTRLRANLEAEVGQLDDG